MRTAQTILTAAANAVCGERNNSYGPPVEDFAPQAAMIAAYLTRSNGYSVNVTGSDIAAIMIFVKLGRQSHAARSDNWLDIAGYAACGAECDEAAGRQ